MMRGLVLLGVLLALLGAGALIFRGIGFTESKPVLKAGPLEVNREETHRISIPTVAGVGLIVVGLGFVFVGSKRT
jgi:hypothetical protein